VIARATGAALLALGAAIAVLPALTWFRAPPVANPTETSGFAGSGQLWLLPALGLVVALAGAGLASSRADMARRSARWAGPTALLAALAALALAVWAAADPVLTLHVTVDGVTESVPATITLAPAAFATSVVAGLAAALGAATAWVGRRR
jgi:hypothetical protein